MSQTTAKYWREIPQRYRGEAVKSEKTGKVYFPPRLVEPGNGNRKFKPVKLTYTGKILTWTVIRVAPMGFERQSPYALGVIELDDGARITSQIVDIPLDKVKIGMKVRVEFRRINDDGPNGIHLYGYKVVPE
ncbi:Zn-ribbon domain-containing OB-fold protein [bacterium]|nr:Zn-ribbon domain-containing OB-fold protein [bacterium]MBU1637124.1 Zn-ribbon domain-containing OB-fold protein [bacterium]MBU1920588.1 Zn-ribbon domain-containing OB-fold protein [bacterium]